MDKYTKALLRGLSIDIAARVINLENDLIEELENVELKDNILCKIEIIKELLLDLNKNIFDID